MPIPDSLRASLGIARAAAVGGGCIHDSYRVTVDGGTYFLKTNDARHADAFAAEADGLAALRAAGMRAPEPLARGIADGHAYLLLEHLDLSGPRDFAALGRMLAAGHRGTGASFGWPRDNYIGTTPQLNASSDDWRTFWLERRIRPQVELAARNGFRITLPALELLEGHEPSASLLHGDLWSGNAGFTRSGPVVFDPAVYYGDREADLAMTELFGGYPAAFYTAYNEAWPVAEGYARRKPLYNLYHLLNHLNLFGSGYLGQVKATLGLLGLG